MAFYALAGSSILASKYLYDYLYAPSTDETPDRTTDETPDETTDETTDETKKNIIKNNEEIDMCEITPTLTPQSLAPLPYNKYRISHKKKND